MTLRRLLRPISLVSILLVLLLAAGPGVLAAPDLRPEKVDVLIAFRSSPGQDDAAFIRGLGGTVRHAYHLVPAMAVTLPGRAVEALQRNPRILRIEPDVRVQALEDEIPWGIGRIGAPLVHAAGNTGVGVKVAIVDSGVDYTHPDLAGLFGAVKGYDFVNGDNDPMDDNSHGTHVAGTVAAEIDGAGVLGVAPGVTLYALKVLDASGSGSFGDIIAAIEWCADNGVQVTNNSYGSSVDPGLIVQSAFDAAYAAGVLHIASAGNSGRPNAKGDTVGYPGKYESVVAVAATDSSDVRASFSSTGPAVELAAPGVAVKSTIPGGGYASYSGTSMASPHVAGVAALVIASGVTGPANVRARLQSTADDLGAAGRDPLFGFGLVDADEAAGGTPPEPTPTTAPTPSTAPTPTTDPTPPAPGGSVHVTTPSGTDGYATEGGKLGTAHLLVTVTLADDQGGPVAGAAVSIRLARNGTTVLQSTASTGADGRVLFKYPNAAAGTYVTAVTAIVSGLSWDGTTPPNAYTKP